MRKPRVIIYDDEVTILTFLSDFFTDRGYDVMIYREPVNCPIYLDGTDCANMPPCSDIIFTDYSMPRMNGFELLKKQSARGCRVPAASRAVASGYLDKTTISGIQALGSRFFEKPFDFNQFSKWIEERESLMDLSKRLATKRRSERSLCSETLIVTVPSEDRTLTGACINTSASGLCLRTGMPLAKELPITVHSGLSGTSHPGTVRWVRETESRSYIAGIQLA